MSPSTLVGSDNEDPRRAMSPAGARSVKPINGVVQTPFPNGKGKAPLRPRRDDEDVVVGTDDGHDAGTSESFPRERTISPDQTQNQPPGASTRAKSPQFSIASRAVSPANGAADAYSAQQPNMVGVSMMNGVGGRASPVIDRTKPPPDAFYNNGGSPAVNGFPRPSSRTGNGSVGNVTADLVRDLKLREAELEGVKRQIVWMKEALSKASRAGYVYQDRDEGADDSGGGNAELALKFKQFRAQMQVSARSIYEYHGD